RQNILKRQLIHVGAFNLSLILRKLLGAGTPRELKNRTGQGFSRFLRSLLNLTTVGSLLWRLTRPAGLRIAPTFRCRTSRLRSRILSRSATACLASMSTSLVVVPPLSA